MDRTVAFEAERARLVGLASRVLDDHVEAEDVVQQAWLRLQRQDGDGDVAGDVRDLPAWLTTVTTRLCLDRLRSRTAVPSPHVEPSGVVPDVGDEVALAEEVGLALQAVLDRLSPQERVAFVLHDSFSVDFAAIATALDTTPAAARKLASRARAKVREPAPSVVLADWAVVDAFMDAARRGQFDRLLGLLAPGVTVGADREAVAAGTPERVDGSQAVAQFFCGRAAAALPVSVGSRPGAAWFHRGQPRVLFDFTVVDGRVERLVFRADPAVLAEVVRRSAVTSSPPPASGG